MTVTYSLDHIISATTEVVNVEVAEKTALTFVKTSTDKDETSSVYVLSSGDASLPATVTFRSSLSKRTVGGIRRLSCTVSTWARAADSVTGEEKTFPILGTISLNIPQDVQIELADLDDFIGNLFSYLYPSVSAGARNTDYLAKLLFGVSKVV